MADQKISELTALTGANLADVDAFAVVDTSAVQTKKITYAELKTALDTGTGFVRITGDTMTGNLSFGDNNKAIFGAELEIYSDATHARIREYGSGQLKIQGDNMQLLTSDGASTYIEGNASTSAVTLYHASNSPRLATTATGISVTGSVTSTGDITAGSSTAGVVTVGSANGFEMQKSGVNAYINQSDSGPIIVRMGSGYSEKLRLTSTGNLGLGGTPATNTKLLVKAGTNLNLEVENSSSNLRLSALNDARSANVGMQFASSAFEFLTGNLGINAIPTQKLHVGGNAIITGLTRLGNGTESSPSYQFVDDTNTGMYRSSSDVLGFSTGGSERVRIDASGNLLVGKTSTIFGTVGVENRADGRITSTRSGNTNLLLNRLASDGDIVQFYKDGASVGSIGTTNGDLYIASSDSGHEGLRLGNGAIVPVDTAGASTDDACNLGGATSRFSDLYLSGGIKTNGNTLDINSGDSNTVATFTSTDTEAQINLVDTTGSAQIRSRNDLRFYVNGGNTRAVDIDSSGNVGIGTTSFAHKLSIQTNANIHLGYNGTSANTEVGRISSNSYAVNNESYSLAEINFTTSSANGYTGDIIFRTNSVNSTNSRATERLRIDSAGLISAGPFGGGGNAIIAGSSSPSYTNQAGTNLHLKSGDGSGSGGSYMTFSTSTGGSSGTTVRTASERLRIQEDGIVVITSGAAPIEPTIKHSGQTGYLAKLRITNRSGQSADKGGLLELGGVSDDGVSRSDIFGSVAGLKSTSGGSNREGYLQFSTSNGSSLAEVARIAPAGQFAIGQTSPQSYHSSADDLVIGNGGSTGITIRSGTTNAGSIFFADGTSGSELYRGYVQYSHHGTASSDMLRLGAGGADRLMILSTGLVGINTTSPEHDLHVKTVGQTEDGIIKVGGTDASLGLEISYDQSSVTTTKIISNPTYGNNSAVMHIAVDGDTNPNQLVLKGDGTVGVGTNNPVAEFAVGGAGRRIEIAGSDGVIRGFNRTSSWAAIDFEALSYNFDTEGSLRWSIDSNGNTNQVGGDSLYSGGGNWDFKHTIGGQNIVFSTTTGGGSTGEILRITNDGKLTLADNKVLQMSSSSTSAAFMQMTDTGSTTYEMLFPDSTSIQLKTHTTSNRSLFLRNSGSGQFNLALYDGTLFVGNSGVYASSAKSMKIDGEGAISMGQNDDATFYRLDLFNSNGRVGSITTNSSSTNFNTTSDYRLKENVDYTWDATTRLKQLKPARFNFISDSTNTTIDGFLAHEISNIVPIAVTGEKDAVNSDGSVNPQSVDASKLVPLLVKTIQELEARITALEA